MERGADELCTARVARTLYDDDIDSPGESRRVDWGEIFIILVRSADCIDSAAQVVHVVVVVNNKPRQLCLAHVIPRSTDYLHHQPNINDGRLPHGRTQGQGLAGNKCIIIPFVAGQAEHTGVFRSLRDMMNIAKIWTRKVALYHLVPPGKEGAMRG